jgi:hypothetical protein
MKGRINCAARSKLLVADRNPSIEETRMMNSAFTKTIPKGPFMRQVERWLVGMAMMRAKRRGIRFGTLSL